MNQTKKEALREAKDYYDKRIYAERRRIINKVEGFFLFRAALKTYNRDAQWQKLKEEILSGKLRG
jgi:hypothetical protein